MSLQPIEALCSLSNPYEAGPGADRLFGDAMQAIVDHHRRHTPGYDAWLGSGGLPGGQDPDDWRDLPPIMADYFKRNLLLSVSGHDARELTSSGTSGQRSRMRYDARSLSAAQQMLDRIFATHGLATPEQPSNYLLFNYEPVGAMTLGTTYTGDFLCKYAPVNDRVHALVFNGQEHEFDAFGVIEALKRFAREGLPVRILGFPAFLWFTLERMRRLDVPPLQLHPDSLIFLGGGWKTHRNVEVPKQELYERAHLQLGLDLARCRSGYGAVEHPVPHVECIEHHYHVPTYARACTRDVATFERLPYGRRGFLQLTSPYITSAPAHQVVMSDMATVHPGHSCACGLQTDWFELHGRAGTLASRSCAVAASELIKD